MYPRGVIAISDEREVKKCLLLVDEDPLVARGLRDLLSLFPDVEPTLVVDIDFDDGWGRVEKSKPDVVLLSISHLTTAVLSLVRGIKCCHPNSIIIVVAGDDRPELVSALLRAGANSYLHKALSSNAFELNLGLSLRGKAVVAVPHPASWLERVLVLRKSNSHAHH